MIIAKETIKTVRDVNGDVIETEGHITSTLVGQLNVLSFVYLFSFLVGAAFHLGWSLVK